MKNHTQGFAGIALAIIIALAVVGGGAYYVGTQRTAKISEETSRTALQLATTTQEKPKEKVAPKPKSDVAILKTYIWGNISFSYPNDWKVLEVVPNVQLSIAPIGQEQGNPNQITVNRSQAMMSCEKFRQINQGWPATRCTDVGDVIVYATSNQDATLKIFNQIVASIKLTGVQVSSNYVSVVESSAQQARFKFTVPVAAENFSKNTVQFCIVSGGAASAGQSDCSTPYTYSLSYDAGAQILTINQTNPRIEDIQVGAGMFRTGCAACGHQVVFSDLLSTSRFALPTKQVVVY